MFCFKWNEFKENINTAFESLRTDTDFRNVTLTSEDGHQIEAHKVILASSSSFFMNVLKRNQHSHPLIYMRGIKYVDLTAIVDFLYYGEANIYQENLDNFLKIAVELELKGIIREKAGEEGQGKGSIEISEKQTDQPTFLTNASQTMVDSFQILTATQTNSVDSESDFKNQESSEMTLDLSKHEISADLDKQIEAMMGRSEKIINMGRSKKGELRMGKAYVCQVCFKEGKRSNIMVHIEAHHLDGILIPCNLCEKTFRSRVNLKQHKSHQHVKDNL